MLGYLLACSIRFECDKAVYGLLSVTKVDSTSIEFRVLRAD